jgi:hypothetical protein
MVGIPGSVCDLTKMQEYVLKRTMNGWLLETEIYTSREEVLKQWHLSGLTELPNLMKEIEAEVTRVMEV